MYMFYMLVLCVAVAQQGVLSAGTHKLRQVTQPVLHGEGPHWDSSRCLLYFVDLNGKRLYRWNPNTDNVTYADVGGELGFAIPVQDKVNTFVGGRKKELVYIPWTGEENVTLSVADMEVVAAVDGAPDKAGNRFNDAKADVTGRLWAGTLGAEQYVAGPIDPNKGSLYSLTANSDVPKLQLTDVDISNGIAWNRANDVMFYIDSSTRLVEAFDFSALAGSISNRRTVFSLDAYNLPGIPDGMAIDSDDHLWIAVYRGGCVIKVDPVARTLLEKIDLPVNRVTSVAFGGVNLTTLYVTTSRRGLTDEELASQPLAGSVLALDNLGVVGTTAHHVRRHGGY